MTMRSVWIVLSSVGIIFQILLIAVLLRGWISRFRVLFAYVVVLFLTTVMEAAAFYSPAVYARTAPNYWLTDAVRQALIFLMVLSLIGQALDKTARAWAFRRVLWGGAAVFVAVSLYATYARGFDFWMTSFSRNLGFLAVILNLVLWAVLLRFRRNQHILLVVCSGMGIQMAGKAIGHSLRQLTPRTPVAGDLILVLSHILCLYIWWNAFRRIDPAQPARLE
jgi:hypothetical protein